MDEEVTDISPVLVPCSVCSRTFQSDALTRHEKVCKKIANSKRKPFNSATQRVEDFTDMLKSTSLKNAVEKPINSDLQEKHKLSRNIQRAKDEVTETMEESTPLKKNIPSDYIQCPSCERHFNKKAAEQHITWCQSQKARMPKRPILNEAKERLQARTMYKAPNPVKKGKEETPNRSAKSVAKIRVITVKPAEQFSSENNDMRNKSEKSCTETISQSPDLEDNFSSFSNVSTPLQDVPQTKTSDIHSPHTVPGVRIDDINTSMNWEQSWSEKMLPEVLSCNESVESWRSRSCLSIRSNTPLSSGRSVRTDKTERARSSDCVMPRFCCHCGSKYPISTAKYCGECGAKRGFEQLSFKGEVFSYSYNCLLNKQ